MLDCIIVGLGGFIGTVCRYLIGLIPVNEGTVFPVKTFLINIAGSFLIGIVAALAIKNHSLNPRLISFLRIGICGGFTTFSSFALESTDLVKNGNMFTALLYIIFSVFFGIAAVFAAQAVIR